MLFSYEIVSGEAIGHKLAFTELDRAEGRFPRGHLSGASA